MQYRSRFGLHLMLGFALVAGPAGALAWPFTSINPAQPEGWVGSAGFNYTIRLQGSVWTVDTDADGQPDGWFAVGSPNADAWGDAPTSGLGAWRTRSAFNINATGGDPLPAESPDVADADPAWAAAFGEAGAQWSTDLASGAGKHVLEAIYTATPTAHGAATINTADLTTTDWALAQWPHVPGAATGRVSVPLSGGSGAGSISATLGADRFELAGWLTEADGKWNLDADDTAPGDEVSFNLAQSTVYLRGTFAPTGTTLEIADPTGGAGTWELTEWTGAPVLHPGPVRTVCASGCTHTTVYQAIANTAPAIANGTLVLIAPGAHNPTPSGAVGSGNGYALASKNHITILGTGLSSDETVLDGFPRDTGLRITSSNHVIVSNLTLERGLRRSGMATTSNRIEFSDVRSRGHGKMVQSKDVSTVTYNGPYGITAFESQHIHFIRVDSRDNATGGIDVVRSQGVFLTDTTLHSNGWNQDWACLYLATKASNGVGGDSTVTFRGANSVSDCFIGIHLEDETSSGGVAQLTALYDYTNLTIGAAVATFRRVGQGLVSPDTTTLARHYNSCWSLRNIEFNPGQDTGELHFRTYADAAAASLVMQNPPVGSPRAHIGPEFDTTCAGVGYVPGYTLEFEGSIWTVDTDNDGTADGFFALGDRAATSWGPGLSQRAFNIPTPSGDPKPNSDPDVPQGDALWGTNFAGDGSAYALELASGAGKAALAAIYQTAGSQSALPLDTNSADAEWAVAQWPFVGNPASGREVIPLSGTVAGFAPVFSGGTQLDFVSIAQEGDGTFNIDHALGAPGDEEVYTLATPDLYLRGHYLSAVGDVEIDNPENSALPKWRLTEWRGRSTLHLGAVREVCHPSVSASWPRLNCDSTTVHAAVNTAPNGSLVVVSPGTFTSTANNAVARISGKSDITLMGTGTGCEGTVLDANNTVQYGVYVTDSSRIAVRNLTARAGRLHAFGASFNTDVEFSNLCGYGRGQFVSNGQAYPGPSGFNFNSTSGVMADIVSADNFTNGIAVFGSSAELRNVTVSASGGSEGWAGIAAYTTGASLPSVASTTLTLRGNNFINGTPMGIFLEDGFDTTTMTPRQINFSHLGTTSITNVSVAPLFVAGFGTVAPAKVEIAQSLDLCWEVSPLKPAGAPVAMSSAFYAGRGDAMGAAQLAPLLGLGTPEASYNPSCDCNALTTTVCEDENPCLAKTCGEEDGTCSTAPRPVGDITGAPSVSVADALCAILIALATSSNSPMPACLEQPQYVADVNCDGVVDLSDVQLVIARAVKLPFAPALDSNGDNCVDACNIYYTLP